MTAESHSEEHIQVDGLVENIIRIGASQGLSLGDLPDALITALKKIDTPDLAIQTEGLAELTAFLESEDGQLIAEMISELPPAPSPVVLDQAAFASALRAITKPAHERKVTIVDGKPVAEYSRFEIAGTIRKKPDEQVGRNDPCPCKSGKKFKKCCGGPK